MDVTDQPASAQKTKETAAVIKAETAGENQACLYSTVFAKILEADNTKNEMDMYLRAMKKLPVNKYPNTDPKKVTTPVMPAPDAAVRLAAKGESVFKIRP